MIPNLMIPSLMMRFFGLNLKHQDDTNAWYLIIEIFWASFLASAASFNAAFALRLGATNADIGLLSSIPALMAILVSIPAGRFIQNLEHRKPWVIGSLAIHRGAIHFSRPAALPCRNQPSPWPDVGLDPDPDRYSGSSFQYRFYPSAGRYRSRRPPRGCFFRPAGDIQRCSQPCLIFGLGQWLRYATYPMNYQVMFLVGIMTSLVSIFYLTRIKGPHA